MVAPPMALPLAEPTTSSPLPAPWSTARLLLLLAVTVLAAALRLWHLELWSWNGDEAHTFQVLAMSAEQFATQPERWYPLLPWLLRQLAEHGWLAGLTEGWLRLPFAFVGALTVPLLAVMAAPLVGTGVAVLAALLLAMHPWHVAQSQTAAPAVVLAAGVTAVFGLVLRRRYVLAAVTQVVMVAVHPLGWLAGLGLLAGLLRGRAAAIALPVVALVAAVAAIWWLDWVRPWLLAAAALAACGPARARSAWLAVVTPAAAAAVLAWAGVVEFAVVGLLALPGVVALATGAVVDLGRQWRSALAGRRWLSAAGAALVAGLATIDGGVENWLRATLHEGNRPAWRAVKDLALGTVQGPGGLLLAAVSGAGPLGCYLRPNDGREAGDPHPGIEVRAIDLALGAAAITSLREQRPDASCLLVLRADEAPQWQRAPELATALQRGFELWRVLPGPRQGGDHTLFVYRRRSAAAPAGPRPGG
jgi:hypothetical protein